MCRKQATNGGAVNPRKQSAVRKIAWVDAILAALMIAVGVAWTLTAQQGAI